MFDRNFEANRIEITEFAYNKIMSWCQALDETVWVCLGDENKIVDAIRLKNISNAPRNCFAYSRGEFFQVKRENSRSGMSVICMGHSHPNKHHLKVISHADWRYLPKGSLQMIIFTLEKKIRIWKIRSSYDGTTANELRINRI